jgi:polyphenol oxidase
MACFYAGTFMIRKESKNIVWLEFELLAPFKNLKHAVFLRHGGYSSGPYQSLNLSYSLHNHEENQNVKANRNKVKEVFGLHTLNESNLRHEDQIVEINHHNNESRPTCDAISTRLTQIALLVTHADCQAAIFYDPINHVVANVHAGWRGNVKNIYGKTVEFMKDRYGSSPQNLHVCISPSLGPNDAEFINFRTELPESFWDYQVKPFYFDLWSISKHQLKNAGVLEHHIQIAGISTLSNPDDYFSYRREKASGRHGTIVELQ